MKRILASAREAVLMFGIVFALLEGTLRLFPASIPLFLLANFQKDVRQNIAFRRNLQSALNTEPFERTDNGPPFYLYRPHATIAKPADRNDRKNGAVKTVIMDEAGFCNRRDSYAKKAVDIIALGDSFTWCTSVAPESTWPAEFSNISGYSTYNLGLPGASPYEYIQLLREFGLSKSPRLVIMNIYGGNDLGEAGRFFDYRKRVEDADATQAVSIAEEAGGDENFPNPPCVALPALLCNFYRVLKESIGRKSYAFNLAANASREAVLKIKKVLLPPEEKSDFNFRYHFSATDGETPLNQKNVDNYQVKFAERFKKGELRPEVLDPALKEFVELSTTHSFIPVVSYTPAAYGAYADRIVFKDSAVGELMLWYEEEQRKFLKERAEKFGYMFLDSTPQFRAAVESSEKRLLYFPVNVHLTKEGHRVLAEALYTFLRQENVSP